jgi:hypothetical protein
MKIAYIDHWFRRISKSTNFIQRLFGDLGPTSLYTAELLNKDFYKTLLESDYNYYVVTQNDPIAIFLLSHQKRVISIPMYDGSGGFPLINWQAQKDALFLNFCNYLHKQTQIAGCKSKYIKYFPNSLRSISTSHTCPDGDDISLFFWERVPSSGISIEWLSHLLSRWTLPVNKVHVHLAPDPGEVASYQSLDGLKRVVATRSGVNKDHAVTISSWFSNKEEMQEVMLKSEVYICPRPAEGIGLSFLEALVNERCVLAIDRPTMSEYITNNINGLLISDLDQTPTRSRPEQIRRLGFQAGLQSRAETETMNAAITSVGEYIANNHWRNSQIFRKPLSPAQAVELSYAFITWPEYYCRLLASYCEARHLDGQSNKAFLISRYARMAYNAFSINNHRLAASRPVLSYRLQHLGAKLAAFARAEC